MKAQTIRHGELILQPVSTLPEAQLKETTSETVLAHSETGHHHVLQTKTKDKIKIHTTIDGKTFVQVEDIAKLFHKKTGQHVHKTFEVSPAIYEVKVKKEFDYFTKKMQEVRD
jgi:hypothetical protein